MTVVRFVVPAFNEAASIGDLLIALASADLRVPVSVVVVDDGSTDGTGEIVRERGAVDSAVTLIAHEVNRGLGRALRTGLMSAVGSAGVDDVIVTMDADLTHDPADAVRLLAAIADGVDVAIASRYAAGSRVEGVGLLRRGLSRAASLLVRLLAPIPGVRDCASGFRAYRAATLVRAFDALGEDLVTEPGFACQLEIAERLRETARFAEVPFTLHYDAKRRSSAVRILPTAAAYLRVLRKSRAAGFTLSGTNTPQGAAPDVASESDPAV